MTDRFEIRDTELSGLRVIGRKPIHDDRGFFERLFSADEMGDVVGGRAIVQINRTFTAKRGMVRGLHFQVPPHAEMKLVCCLQGHVYDVAVDLRHNSPTLLQWHGEILRDDESRSLLIPEGFAHGFQALTDDCELLYFHSAPYVPASERGISPTDPAIRIDWPEPVVRLSRRDSEHPKLPADYSGIDV